MEGVETASVDMCAYGMRVDTGAIQGPARKRTKTMSNSNEVIKRIAVKCPNFEQDESKHHVHVPLRVRPSEKMARYIRASSAGRYAPALLPRRDCESWA